MRPPDIDYEKDFEEFWKPLVCTVHADGSYTLDEDSIKRELADYHFVMENTSRLMDELTWGRISKPNTMAFEVIAVVNELETQHQREEILAWLVALEEEHGHTEHRMVTLEEVEKSAHNYFSIEPVTDEHTKHVHASFPSTPVEAAK